MAAHGQRCGEIVSDTRTPFRCHVCATEICSGATVVAFKNHNKRPPADFDHVCAGACAERYTPPPLRAAPTTMQRIGGAIAAVGAAVREKVIGGPSTPTREQTYLEKARILDVEIPDAERVAGAKRLSTYLRAMGMKIGESMQGDADALRERVTQTFCERGIDRWSVNSDEHGAAYVARGAKRAKSA